MAQVITFKEALDQSKGYTKRHLLLGNGFSIACKYDIFTYKSLLDEADFADNPKIKELFSALDTVDFEAVIRILQESAKVLSVYEGDEVLASILNEHSTQLKTILISTIAGKHPNIPSEVDESQYESVRTFLSHFLGKDKKGNVYTLNYDLLLYWAVMHEDETNANDLKKNDGFGKEEGNEGADYVVWQGERDAHNQRIHYLHGALHLFDAGRELKKFTWINTGRRLIEQTREAMDEDMYPLFVSEGTSEQKLTKIKHSGFLYHSFKSFSKSMNTRVHCLFIYGHSLAENDMHILYKIASGTIEEVFISIYGDIESDDNQIIVDTANFLIEERERLQPDKPLTITYYDAESADVWG